MGPGLALAAMQFRAEKIRLYITHGISFGPQKTTMKRRRPKKEHCCVMELRKSNMSTTCKQIALITNAMLNEENKLR